MKLRTSRRIAAAGLALAGIAFWRIRGTAQTPAGATDGPKYGNGSNLIRPTDYREWMFLSSSLGLSYQPSSTGSPTFQNVFVNPSSYRAFMQTGKWPDFADEVPYYFRAEARRLAELTHATPR